MSAGSSSAAPPSPDSAPPLPSPPAPAPDVGRLFCFGLGFSALALARRLAASGWAIAGTTRSAEKAAPLTAAGIAAYVFDRAHPPPEAAPAGTTHTRPDIVQDDTGGGAGQPALDP